MNDDKHDILPQAKKEDATLDFWNKERIFLKSVEQRKNSPIFNFYDGPPFASGPPHYGHILASTIKDTVTRYWTMRGYLVNRAVGWDCHGLPVENLVEKELGLKTKKDIERLGNDKASSIIEFNKHARESVIRFVDIWKKTLTRIGRWSDYSSEYFTLNNEYIESVWWVFKQLWDKGLIYKDFRVTPYCAHCGTPLSNFEVNQGYKETKDPSIYIKYKVKSEEENTYFLVWTTTPWTLPANVALAVGEDIEYIKAKMKSGEQLILAKDHLDSLDEGYNSIKNLNVDDIIGLEYEPLFNFIEPDKKAYFVIGANFVFTEEGTGIVHMAPFFGEDDLNASKEHNLPILKTVDLEGKFIKEVQPWAGKFVKDADEGIIADLKKRGLLYKEERAVHTYPFCWRCDTPLLYYAIDAWYIATTKIQNDLIKNNLSKKLKQADGSVRHGIHWLPTHLKEGRFGKWLEGVKDWAVSRNRFWGAPIPIWECKKCGERTVVGSIKDLGEKTPKDLHRPYIDDVELPCKKCKGTMKRIEEVFDCWFESGSMPYAQWHHPFTNKESFNPKKGIGFPADFIAEGLDQTRGWFYTLHVLATALFNKPAFKNVIVNGLILAEDGKKLSKKLKNYTEPEKLINQYGADSLRLFLLASTSIGEDYRFSDQLVKEYLNRVIMTLENVVNFYMMFKGNFQPTGNIPDSPANPLDRWLAARQNETIKRSTEFMDDYELTRTARLLEKLIKDISVWYVRRSRARFKEGNEEDKKQAIIMLGEVLLSLTKILAPFAPFTAERVYKTIRATEMPQSVHLADWPQKSEEKMDEKILSDMERARDVVECTFALRAKNIVKVRQPLSEMQVFVNKKPWQPDPAIQEIVLSEVNVRKFQTFDSLDDFEGYGKKVQTLSKGNIEVMLNLEITDELLYEGYIREIIRHINNLRKQKGLTIHDRVKIEYNSDNKKLLAVINEFKPMIEKKVLASSLTECTEEHEHVVTLNDIELQISIKHVT